MKEVRSIVIMSYGTNNDSGRFEDRWVYLEVNANSPCIFTKGIKGVYLPIRHGEGKFVAKDEALQDELKKRDLVVLQYSDATFQKPIMEYPLNPNGSVDTVAGICDETGRLLGMMPHPEVHLHGTNHPSWAREELPQGEMGLAFFRNAVQYV